MTNFDMLLDKNKDGILRILAQAVHACYDESDVYTSDWYCTACTYHGYCAKSPEKIVEWLKEERKDD